VTSTSDAPSRERTAPGAAASARAVSRPAAAAVAAVLAAGLVLRFVARSPLWLDEALSVNIARLPWGSLHDALKHDGAPPLYYALLHVWTGVFGGGNEAARALSGVFGAATLPLAWFAGRRVGGRSTAWAAVLLLALNPYALRYGTEARMYWFLAFLVFAGILVFRRAYEQPTVGRLVAAAVVVAALVYTQYWAFYLVATTAALLLFLAWRGDRSAVRLLVAVAVGLATFLPWLPTFLYQARHTGTPWGQGRFLGYVFGTTFLDFAGSDQQEGYLLWFVLVALVLLGAFAVALDGRRIRVDLEVQPAVRAEAFLGVATLALGGLVSWVADSAFQSRYSAIVFPFFLLLAARGVACFADVRVRAAVLAVVCLLGVTGGVRNARADRTQAGDVAAALRANAKAGDLVVYCPDQLGPAVSRIAPADLRQVTYPRLASPRRVDWVDYEDVLRRHDPGVVASRVRSLAGTATIFVVTASGYRTHVGICEAFVNAVAGGDRGISQLVTANDRIIEKMSLLEIARR
jgi:mannosyltransferase